MAAGDWLWIVSLTGALELSPLLPEDYRAAVAQLKEFYYAIEIDPVMTIEEKVPHMVDWYGSSCWFVSFGKEI